MGKLCKRCLVLLTLVACLLQVCPIAAQASAINEDGHQVVVITLDPGHGGSDSGDTEHYGGTTVKESVLNWKIANYCKEALEANYWNVEVHLSRSVNECPDRVERVRRAASWNSDFLLSIHLNAGGGGKRGAMALVPCGNYRPAQASFTTSVGQRILKELETLGIKNDGLLLRMSEDGNRYPDGSLADYYGIIYNGMVTGVPSVLIEHAFLDSSADYYAFLSSEEKLKAIGQADARALADALGLEDISLKPAPRVSSAAQGDTPFTDVYVDDWYYDDVTFAYAEQLMNGTGDTTFSPKTGTTRGMVATLLYRLEGAEFAATQSHFTDVKEGSWYYEAVEWAAEVGVTLGLGDGTFQPNTLVTREQMVTFLYRYAQLKGYDYTPTTSLDDFKDGAKVSSFAKEAMAWAVAVGLVNGVGDQKLDPQGQTTRGQLAALFHRYVLNVVTTTAPVPDEDTTDTPDTETPDTEQPDSNTTPEEVPDTTPNETDPETPGITEDGQEDADEDASQETVEETDPAEEPQDSAN